MASNLKFCYPSHQTMFSCLRQLLHPLTYSSLAVHQNSQPPRTNFCTDLSFVSTSDIPYWYNTTQYKTEHTILAERLLILTASPSSLLIPSAFDLKHVPLSNSSQTGRHSQEGDLQTVKWTGKVPSAAASAHMCARPPPLHMGPRPSLNSIQAPFEL